MQKAAGGGLFAYHPARKTAGCRFLHTEGPAGEYVLSRDDIGEIMNILNLQHITKNYGTRSLFTDLSLGVNSGDKIGVIGVNGTGKSTLLKIAAGIVHPDEGTVIKGRDVRIAYLAQTPDFGEDRFPYEAVMHGRTPGTEAEAEARSMLNRLGIVDHSQNLDRMSGGQRKWVALAQTLLSPAEVLILDEPTNHLDQEMILYLEDAIRRFKGELLLVTHDRYFLDNVTNKIAELDRGGLYVSEGGYETYLKLKEERAEMEAATEDKRENLIRTELAWISRGARARSTKQQARIGRFEDLREASREARQKMEKSTLQVSSISTRLGKKTVELLDISRAYGDRTLFSHFTYRFLRDDRIGFIGPNGCGKSTLMNVIAGSVTPDTGHVEYGETVKIGYFRQEAGELDPDETVIGCVKGIGEYVRTTDGLITASQMCEKFLFDKKMQWAKIGNLSGGERRRLQLLLVLMSQPNVLMLDEPTNDLDIETLEIFEDYLDHFLGIIIVVSHDRYFLDRVVNRIFSFEDGELVQYEGGFTDYYEKRLLRGQENSTGKEASSSAGTSAGTVSYAGSAEAGLSGAEAYAALKSQSRKKKMTYREQQEYEHIDEEIAALEKKVRDLDSQIEECATQYTKLEELSKERQEAEEQLSAKEDRWLELQELAEEIASQNRSAEG